MGLEPENTLRSFRRAVAEGADAVELDLWVSRDGHLVILHDGDVSRTTDGKGNVADLTLAELKALDAGRGETIPTFDEVLDVVDIPIQAEIKAFAAGRVAVDTIRDRELLDRVTVTSFSVDVIADTRDYFSGVRTGLISSRAPQDLLDKAGELGVEVLCLGLAHLDAEFVGECDRRGLEVIGWPANDADRLLHALRIGVAGVTSDFPDLLRTSRTEVPEVGELLAARAGTVAGSGQAQATSGHVSP
nr:glycerophosphodiester phosphodiesterase family protein [Actinopolymorpha cephalotaxi]